MGKGGTEGKAVVGAAKGLTGACEVVGQDEGTEFVFGEGSLALGAGVEGVGLVKFTGRDGVIGILGTAGFEERGKEVLVFLEVKSGGGDAFGFDETVAGPLLGTLDGPGEDGGKGFGELIGKFPHGTAAEGGSKGDNFEKLAEGGEFGRELREDGGGEPEFGLREERSEGEVGGARDDGVGVEERGKGGIVTRFEERGERGSQEASTDEAGVEGTSFEKGEVLGIGAEGLIDNREEELLRALIRAVEKEGEALASMTGEGVADGELKVVLEVEIGVGEQVEEGGPGRGDDSVWMVGDGDETGNIVIGIVGLKFEGGEVEGAIKDGDEVGVRVEGGREQGDAGERAGEGEEGFEVGRGLAALGMFEEAGTEGSVGI
jgi:hypothetical protein